MDKEEIISTLQALARSQGSYGRMVDSMTPEALEYLEAQNFTDPVDLIMFLEG